MTKAIDLDEATAVVSWLGFALGTASGWDQPDDWVVVHYGFIPNDHCPIPGGTLTIDFSAGTIEVDNEHETWTSSVATLLATPGLLPVGE